MNKLTDRMIGQFGRMLRNFRYERTQNGIRFENGASFGGTFYTEDENGLWIPGKNSVTLQWLDALYDCYFNNGSPPAELYLAPFSANVAPSSALTAANFTATQGEYTGYSETARQPWTSNGPSDAQTVSNSEATAAYTVGTGGATIRGAGLLTAPTKGATTGVLVAAGLFDVSNTLGQGSTLKIRYDIAGAPDA